MYHLCKSETLGSPMEQDAIGWKVGLFQSQVPQRPPIKHVNVRCLLDGDVLRPFPIENPQRHPCSDPSRSGPAQADYRLLLRYRYPHHPGRRPEHSRHRQPWVSTECIDEACSRSVFRDRRVKNDCVTRQVLQALEQHRHSQICKICELKLRFISAQVFPDNSLAFRSNAPTPPTTTTCLVPGCNRSAAFSVICGCATAQHR